MSLYVAWPKDRGIREGPRTGVKSDDRKMRLDSHRVSASTGTK